MKSTLFVILLFVSLLRASAFLPGPDLIRACPHCEQKIRQPTMRSGNTYHGQHWTDGMSVYPWFPDWPAFVKCPKCEGLFWIAEAKRLGYESKEDDVAKGAKGPESVKPEECYDYLKNHSIEPDKEIHLRLRLWWAANDRWRKNAKVITPAELVPLQKSQVTKRNRPKIRRNAPNKYSEREQANLEALDSLLDQEKMGHRILKAEIARELGRFDACEKLLDGMTQEMAVIIRTLAQRQDSQLKEIRDDTDE